MTNSGHEIEKREYLTMKEYTVTFCLSMRVEADDIEEAENLAADDFAANYGAYSVSDFAMTDAELVEQ